eukprot:s1593_g3.t1
MLTKRTCVAVTVAAALLYAFAVAGEVVPRYVQLDSLLLRLTSLPAQTSVTPQTDVPKSISSPAASLDPQPQALPPAPAEIQQHAADSTPAPPAPAPDEPLFTNAPQQVEPPETTYVVAPSDISARLASLFQVCGLCSNGLQPKRFGRGGYAICEELLGQGVTAPIKLAGDAAWNKFGADLTVLHPELSLQVLTCSPSATRCPPERPGCGMLRTEGGIACTNEELLSSYPVLLAKIPGGQNNFVAVVNRGHYIWKHLLDTRRIWSNYRMMILELPWLEEQTHHLYYLRVMEVLLHDFKLVHVDASTCHGRWQIRSTEVGMPRVVQATFVRKDLAVAQACTTQLHWDSSVWDCPDLPRSTPPQPLSLVGAPVLGEPHSGVFQVYASPIDGFDDVLVPHRSVSLELLKRFRLCHTCAAGDSDFVRIGGNRDGGYLICGQAARDLTLAFSIGIRGMDPFGAALSEEFGPRVEGFDCTGDPYRCPAALRKCRFNFNPLCLGKPFGGKPASQFLSLSEILDRFAEPSDEMLLKIDCEGCEWNVLPEIPSEVLKRFRMIVMEAHWLETQQKHPTMLKAMDLILENFHLVHSHGCNRFDVWTVNGTDYKMPRVVELTFVRKDLAVPTACENSKYRNGLDKPICGFRELNANHFRLPAADSESR